jgi:hypothetical protein
LTLVYPIEATGFIAGRTEVEAINRTSPRIVSIPIEFLVSGSFHLFGITGIHFYFIDTAKVYGQLFYRTDVEFPVTKTEQRPRAYPF